MIFEDSLKAPTKTQEYLSALYLLPVVFIIYYLHHSYSSTLIVIAASIVVYFTNIQRGRKFFKPKEPTIKVFDEGILIVNKEKFFVWKDIKEVYLSKGFRPKISINDGREITTVKLNPTNIYTLKGLIDRKGIKTTI